MRFHILSLAALCLPLPASELYWDGDGEGVVGGKSGTWSNSLARWSPDPNGSSYQVFQPGDTARFQGDSGTVTLGSHITASRLDFLTPGYTITGPYDLKSLYNFRIRTVGGDQTITTGITATSLRKDGPGSLLLTGAVKLSSIYNTEVEGKLIVGDGGSIISPAGGFDIGTGFEKIGTLELNDGGTISSKDTYIGTAYRGEGHANVTGGIWTNSGIFVVGGFDGQGTLSISGGLVSAEGFVQTGEDTYTGSASIQLSGTSGNRGTLYTNRIVDAATVNGTVTFDGGILKARSNQSDFISNYSTGEIIFDSGGAFIDSNGFDIGIGSQLSGTGGLNKLGAGTLTLTRTNNYAGSTVVNNGTLKLIGSVSTPSAETIIGNASGDDGTLQFSGGTLTNTNARVGNAAGSQGSATVTSGTWDNSGTLWIGYSGTGSLLVDGGTVKSASAVLGYTGTTGNGSATVTSGSWTNSGDLVVGRAGAGSLIVSGSGLVTVDGITRTGNFGGATGSITLSGSSGNRGTLSTNKVVETGGTGSVTFDGGILQARVDETDFLSSYESGEVTINSGGAFIDSNGHNIGISTALGGTGGLTKQGTGTLTLSGTSAYTGGTTVSDGALSLGHASNTLANNGTVTISGGTLALGANSDTVGALSLSSGSITGSGGTLTASSYAFTDSGSVSANLAGSGALTKTGAGTVTLSGSNTYSGGTTVSAGTLQGTTYALRGNIANNAALIFDQEASGTFVGDISGSGTLTKQGTGTVILAGSNTYSGGTTVSAGTLQGSTSSLQGNITNNTTLVFQQDTSGTYAGDISGSGTLTKQGAGTVNLSDSNTYSGGTTISDGALSLGHATNTLADNGAITISGGTLALGANSDTVGALSLSSGSITGSGGTLTASSYAFTDSGSVSANLAGDGALTKTGAGTVTLSGSNTYTGGTVVNSGTLKQGASGAFSSNYAYTVNGGTLALNGHDLVARSFSGTGGSVDLGTATLTVFLGTATGSTEYAGVIHGTGGLDNTTGRRGGQTLTLSGSNTYSGGTTVSAGTLSLAHNNAAGSGEVMVNGGTLHIAEGISPTNAISLAGGSVERDFGAGDTLVLAFNVTSKFTGAMTQTTASFLDGTTSVAATLTGSFAQTVGADNDESRQSDVFSLSGGPVIDLPTGETDLFVLQLQVANMDADSFLGWLDPGTNIWVNAVDGNFGGTSTFQGDAAYNPGTDFVLGYYGIDTANNSVWAVINHNSEFSVVGIPEPSAFAMLGCTMGALLLLRRRA